MMTLDIVYILMLLGLSFFGFHRLVLLCMSGGTQLEPSDMTGTQDKHLDDVDQPRITVQLPIYNERHVATRLIDAACQLDYQNDRLEIQVLDDSTDDSKHLIDQAVERWRTNGVAIRVIRRSQRIGYKAGALTEGLEHATGDLIAIFDADFIPQPSFLRSLMPYFSNPKIGMVQARWAHLNRHESLLTEAQAILLDGHFSIEQQARNRNGLWFNFNGTAGIWRRQCIEDAGGWAHETLTEDLDISYRAQMNGWCFKYVDGVGVPAELPTNLDAFRSQQHRWAKGSIQVAKKLLPAIIKGKFPLQTKFEAVCHLLANLNYILVCGLCISLPLMIVYSPQAGLFSWIGGQIFLAGSCCFALFYLGSQRRQQPTLRVVILLPFVFALGLSLCLNNTKAVIEALVGQVSPFVRTPKSGSLGSSMVLANGYRVDASTTLNWLENFMLVAYLAALFISIHHGAWQHLPLLMLFIAGFSSRFWGSLGAQISPRFKTRSIR